MGRGTSGIVGVEQGFYGALATTPIIAIVYVTYKTYLKNVEISIAQAEQAQRHANMLQESEERFRSAFDYAAIGMALVSQEGHWLQVNRSLCQIVGYSEEELLAMDFQAITHPEDLGDLLLQHVADRLRRHYPETDMLAQLGGGTFAVALDVTKDASDPMPTLRGSLAAVFGQPFAIEGREIPVTVKSGLALYPTDGTGAAVLVQNAEAALRNARASGERVLTFSLEQRSEVVARLALEHKLRTAIERQQFELHYQPKMNIHSRRIEGVEALIRWRDPGSGLVAPSAFLPLLESTGLIVDVGNWVLEQAARDSQQWQRRGLPAIRVAVNVSTVQLRRPDFADRFLQVITPWANSACGLDIEITEGALLDDCAAEVRRLKLLRTAGVRIAIDDFGTGYSSLSRLSDLPIDTLKIDRTFINRIPDNGSGKTLVSTIISLAHAFGMSVVAEGVETEEQLGVLWEMGCDEAQGFLLSKPVARDAFAELLENGKGRLMSLAGPAVGTGR